ncbi:MAG: ATP synthase F1 subunit gamma [Dehalococcoidales bacterium]|jgi:F-type H+-transporting ATPase subunit gamma|nr:ATP synthase F1 subunit gamma [Dehalococcoidales bacterium]
MANTRLIRRRIKGIQNTAKITRAMEMVASSKMRKAQERGLAGRPYTEKIEQVIADLAALPHPEEELHALLQRRPVKKIAIIHITPDRGLTGGLDANLNRKTASFILQQSVPVALVLVGRRGIEYMRRYGREIRAEFSKLGDNPGLLDTLPISRIIIEDYTNGLIDMAYIAYAQFVNTLKQTPVIRQILPVIPAQIPKAENVDYIFEPDHHAVLDLLLPRFVESEVYHAILESIASEQSARMVAMRNATESANELIQSLTLAYYKARQESITAELLDIVGGASAIS